VGSHPFYRKLNDVLKAANFDRQVEASAEASGVKTPSVAELEQFDRTCKKKSLSSRDRESPTDSDAKITRLKDGRTRLGYKVEHAVDAETGTFIEAEVHPGDAGDAATGPETATRSGHTASSGIQFKRFVFFKIKFISFIYEKIADLPSSRILDSEYPRGDGDPRFRAPANRESDPDGITGLFRDPRRRAGPRAAALEPHPREGRKEPRCA
jgi:hypothetical protein